MSEPPAKLQLQLRTRLFLTLISSVTDRCRRDDLSINRRLLNFLDFKSSPTTSSSSVVSSDFTVDPSRDLWCRLYTPPSESENESPLPLVIYFHGGGFTFSSASSFMYDFFCWRLAKQVRCHVVSVNYRLAPEHKFPSQYDDGFDVLKFLDDSYCNSCGLSDVVLKRFDLSKCFLAGDSAGANIAHHVAVRACRTGFRALKVIGLIAIQPFFGGEERTESELQLTDVPLVSVSRTDWQWKAFLPEGSNRDRNVVNVSGPKAEDIASLDEFPETMVVTAGFDPLKDWQRRYYEWLKKSGKEAVLIEYPNMFHAFYLFPEIEERSHLLSQVHDYVSNRVSKL